jgi:DNA-binding NtrC family response regulator
MYRRVRLKTILILDDEQAVRQSFSDYFEDRFWLPIQAESAEEALIMLESEQVIAAVVDVRLPDMDGTDFIRAIHKKNLVVACVICTGSPEFELPQDLYELTPVSNVIFKKPVSDLDMLESEVVKTLDAIEIEERSR